MVFKKGDSETARKGGLQQGENRKRGVEKLLTFLAGGGSERVEELYKKMLNDEELTKGEREFLGHHKDLMEYHTPKLTRVSGSVNNDHKVEVTIKYGSSNPSA